MAVTTLHRMQRETTATSCPGRMVQHQFTADTRQYYLVLSPRGDIQYVLHEDGQEPEHAIALLQAKEGSALLASLVEGCEIESAVNTRMSFPLQRSSLNNWHWIHLRPGDNVHFEHHAFSCTFTIDSEVSQASVRVEPRGLHQSTAKIQVESSIPDCVDPVDDDTEDELDGPMPDVANGGQGHLDGTALPVLNPETQVYSTAQERSFGLPEESRSLRSPAKHVGDVALSGVPQHVLETPIKKKANPAHHAAVTPAAMDLQQSKENTNVEPAGDDISVHRSTPNSSFSKPSFTASGALKRRTPMSSLEQLSGSKTKKARASTVQPSASKRKKASSSVQIHLSPPAATPSTPALTGNDAHAELPRAMLFTSSKYKDDKKMHTWLRKHDVEIAKEIPDKSKDFTCIVGDGEIPKTAKLLRSLALGKSVVQDQWLTASREADELIPHAAFLWSDAAPTTDRSHIFYDKTILATSKLQKEAGWHELSALVMEAGAARVVVGTSRKLQDEDVDENTICLGSVNQDDLAQHIADRFECPIYQKDLITASVFDGELHTDVESMKINFSAQKGKRRS